MLVTWLASPLLERICRNFDFFSFVLANTWIHLRKNDGTSSRIRFIIWQPRSIPSRDTSIIYCMDVLDHRGEGNPISNCSSHIVFVHSDFTVLYYVYMSNSYVFFFYGRPSLPAAVTCSRRHFLPIGVFFYFIIDTVDLWIARNIVYNTWTHDYYLWLEEAVICEIFNISRITGVHIIHIIVVIDCKAIILRTLSCSPCGI
jgi:hypothetical protein